MIRFAVSVGCVLLFFWITPTQAECPSPDDMDVMYNETNYYGVYYYEGDISRSAIQSCNGEPLKLIDGYSYSLEKGKRLLDHALVVQRGCIVYEFADVDYKGKVTEFPAGVHPFIQHDEAASLKVRCNLDHIDCHPTDGYSTILVCDATGATEDTKCNYHKTVGTKLSKGLSTTASLSASLEYAVEASFFEVLKKSLTISGTIGFDYTSLSDATKTHSQTFKVEATAPAEKILKIEQAVATCGNSKVYTEFFRISHVGRDGDDTDVQNVRASQESQYLLESESLA